MIIRKNSIFSLLFSASSSFLSFSQLSFIPKIKIYNISKFIWELEKEIVSLQCLSENCAVVLI